MNTTEKILVAAVTGAATGLVLGILFAPDSGEVTRRKINEEGLKLSDELKYRFRRGKEKLNNIKDDIEDNVKESIGAMI